MLELGVFDWADAVQKCQGMEREHNALGIELRGVQFAMLGHELVGLKWKRRNHERRTYWDSYFAGNH